MKPFMDGGSQENGLRAGTENAAAIIGMAVSLEKNCLKLRENCEYIQQLSEKMVSELKRLGKKFLILGDRTRVPGIVSLAFPNIEGEIIFTSA